MTEEEQGAVAQPKFNLTIEGEGLNFSQSIGSDQVATIMALALGVQPLASAAPGASPARLAPLAAASPVAQGERLSLREFLDEVEAKRIPEKILAIGAYLAVQESQSLFTRDDVRGRFRSAGEPLPGNFPRDFGVAVSSGWIAEDHGNAGSFYVTRTGNQVVSSKFAPEVARVQRRVRRRRLGRGGDSTED